MTFTINNRLWAIEEVSQDELIRIKEDYSAKESGAKYYGITCYYEQTIYIWEDMHKEQKRQTLLHELMHCYIGVFYDFQNNSDYTEEAMCNISANSHYIIHDIVEKYFKK